ncbi:hypothetical protein Cflav_PD2374 [Pedosphaera parvula Ellin514]|uniref:Uncharacterized protein n=1 Tax=Pedosphaera parvula (strain Ellin514) TaxID=320771 RepID=B9XLR2_PEDPL|nr:hypothetical protein Cflav_PD2374 [Pedosphaera parvula Ellin514]
MEWGCKGVLGIVERRGVESLLNRMEGRMLAWARAATGRKVWVVRENVYLGLRALRFSPGWFGAGLWPSRRGGGGDS